MKNIALILGAFAGAVPGNRANTIYAKGSTQTDEAAQPLYLPPADKMRQPIYGGLQPSQPYQSHYQNPGYATENSYVRQYFNGPIQAAGPVQRIPFYPQVNGNNNQDHVKGYRPSAGEQPSGQDMFPYGIPPYNTINNPDRANVGDKRDNPEYDDYVDYREEPLRQNKAPVQDQQKKQNPPVKRNNNQDQESQERSAREQPPVQPQVLPTSETKPAKIVASQLSDEEIIDAVLVFENFNCDLHIEPSVEASQKRIDRDFFSSHYRFVGLNWIKVKKITCTRKGDGKNRNENKVSSMIVNYQASVSESRNKDQEFFDGINKRLSKSFEFIGYKSEEWVKTYDKTSEVMKSLIDSSLLYKANNLVLQNSGQHLDQEIKQMMENKKIQNLLTIMDKKEFMQWFNKTGEEAVASDVKKFESLEKKKMLAATELILKYFSEKAKSEAEVESPVDLERLNFERMIMERATELLETDRFGMLSEKERIEIANKLRLMNMNHYNKNIKRNAGISRKSAGEKNYQDDQRIEFVDVDLNDDMIEELIRLEEIEEDPKHAPANSYDDYQGFQESITGNNYNGFNG